MADPAYDDCSPRSRAHAISQLTALVSAATAELLATVAAADRADDWRADGAIDMPSWLAMHLHLGQDTARDWVRVAHALEAVPAIRAGFAEGSISWDQLVAVTTFATPETDDALADELPSLTAAMTRRLARRHRPRTSADDAAALASRRLRFRPDHEAGGYRLSGFLTAEEGATLRAVIDRRAEAAGPDAATGQWAPLEERRADALVGLALDHHGGPGAADPTIVVVHADAAVVAGAEPGNGEVGERDQVPISAEAVRRLLCDATIEVHLDGPDGTTVGIGRAHHDPPRWLRRRILRRDHGTCRFPGCDRPIRHLHHIRWWQRDHGRTDADNLCGLCWHHHHLVHEGGWTITGNPEGTLTFTAPDGHSPPERPPPLDPDVRRRIAQRYPLDPDPPSSRESPRP